MDSTNATSPDDELHIDWGVPDEVGAPPADPALTLPPDLFAPTGTEPVADATPELPEEETSAFVLDDLFADGADEAPMPPVHRAGTPLVVGDLASTVTAVKTRPRLGAERTSPSPPKAPRNLGSRKLWISAAVVAAVVGLATLLNQPPDPSVDVRSAAQPNPAPTVTASTRPLPSTTASTTTPTTAPSTTTPGDAGPAVSTASPVTTAAAASRPTVAPTPVTTAAPPRPAPAPPTSTATTQPDLVDTTEPPPPDTTVTTRRPRETIPPPTTAPSTTSSTVEPGEGDEVD